MNNLMKLVCKLNCVPFVSRGIEYSGGKFRSCCCSPSYRTGSRPSLPADQFYRLSSKNGSLPPSSNRTCVFPHPAFRSSSLYGMRFLPACCCRHFVKSIFPIEDDTVWDRAPQFIRATYHLGRLAPFAPRFCPFSAKNIAIVNMV